MHYLAEIIRMEYLTDFIRNLGYLGYIVLFLIIFFESFPFTFFLPGDSLLFAAGLLASQGYFSLPLLILTFFLGAVFGFMFSYRMGERIRTFILKTNDRYWFKKKHLDYTEDFFKKYGDKTIIISRFVPIVRSFAPTLAGTADMTYGKFIRDSILGGFIWTVGVTSIGYYLGRSIPGADRYLTPMILLIVFVSQLPLLIEYLRHSRNKNV